MAETAARMLPFLIIGAWVPMWTIYITVLLGTNRPIANAMAYVSGNAVYRLLLALAALMLIDMRRVMRDVDALPPPPPVLVGTVGALLLAGGLFLLVRRPQSKSEGQSKVLGVLAGLSPAMVFGYGMLGMALPGLQYVWFLGGIGVLSRSKLPPDQQLLLLALFIVLLQVMLLTPIVLFAARRERVTPFFARAREWLALRGSMVLGFLLSALGGYLLLTAVLG